MRYRQQCEIVRFALRNGSFLHPNDLNGLRGYTKSLVGCAKDLLRFLVCWISSATEVQAASRPPQSLPSTLGIERWPQMRGVKKLRESAAKALKLLVRVNLCAGLPERPGLPEGSAGLTKVERRPSLWDLLPPSPEANQARLRSKFDDPFKGEGLQVVLRSGFPRVCDSRAFAGGPN
jgi:hypothetical protein